MISNFFFYFHEFKMIKFFWRLFLNPWQIFYFLNKFIDRRVINKIKLRWGFLLCSPTFCARYLFILWFFLILFLKIGISICKQRFCFIIKFITNINNILALKLFVMNISLIFNHVLNPVIWCYFLEQIFKIRVLLQISLLILFYFRQRNCLFEIYVYVKFFLWMNKCTCYAYLKY